MQWTHDTPTVPGLYAWRDGWGRSAQPAGNLFFVYAPAGTLGVLRVCRLDGSRNAPVGDSALAGGEWLGPLPE